MRVKQHDNQKQKFALMIAQNGLKKQIVHTEFHPLN
jgi:hypothetical protein